MGKRTQVSLPGDKPVVVHGSRMTSYVIGQRICDDSQTCCGKDDTELEVTTLIKAVTCKLCLTWIENHRVS